MLIEINDDLKFLEDGKRFITTNERDGFKHIYLYNLNGKLEAQLTKGNFDVDNVLGVDEKTKNVYFTAAYYSPMDRQLFSVNYGGNKNPYNRDYCFLHKPLCFHQANKWHEEFFHYLS